MEQVSMNRRADDKAAGERLAFASMWIGILAFGFSFWYGVCVWLTT